MKRIFLTSGLVMCLACPAFATDPDIVLDSNGAATNQNVTTGEECVEEVLGTYQDGATVQLEAAWSADPFTITFNKGTVGSRDVSTYVTGTTSDIPVTFDSRGVTLTNGWSAVGYHFTGWSSPTDLSSNDRPLTPTTYDGTPGLHNANYSSPVLASYGYAPDSGSSVTLTAQWAPNTYDVVYHDATKITCVANSESCVSGVYTHTNGATFDSAYTAKTMAQADMQQSTGYTFVGWSTDSNPTVTRDDATTGTVSNAYVNGTTWTRTSNLDLYASYIANQYDITYNIGSHGACATSGNCSNGNYVASRAATYDENFTPAATLSDVNMVANTGYTFRGWNTATGQTSANYTGAAPWASTSNLTLYAAYTANQTTVSYSCGQSLASTPAQGTWTAPSGWAGNSQTATYDSPFAHPAGASVCSLAGYQFDGWNCVTGTTGSTTGGITNDGISNGNWNVDAENVICTATWTRNTIDVDWYSDGAEITNVPQGADSCQYDGTLVVPTAPDKKGYTFQGWTVRDVQPATPAQGD